MRSETDALLSVQRFFAESVLPEPWDVRLEVEEGEPPERPFALIEQSGPAATVGAPATQDITIPVTANLFLPAAATRQLADDAALALRETIWQAVKWGDEDWRPTTDRIPLYAYQPRIECHRFSWPLCGALPDTFTVTLLGETTDPLPRDGTTAAELADAITGVLTAAGVAVEDGDVVGYDRATHIWDIYYQGSLAGQRIGDPVMNGGIGRTMLEGAAAPWRGPSDYMRVESFAQNTVRDQTDPKQVMVAVDLRLTFGRGLPLPLDRRVLERISLDLAEDERG